MKVLEKYQNSNLNNSDVKWYLFREQLWVTKCKNYTEIEKSISKSVGSFNFLYESNDTVLFHKEGRFETTIIYLSGRINNDIRTGYADILKTGKRGDIFLSEKKNIDFEFPSPVVYNENEDILLSLPMKFDIQKDKIIYIVDDFGFFIANHRLKGWFLKDASGHVCITQEYNKEITPLILARYLKALKVWEESEDKTELEGLLEECEIKEKEFSHALRQCIMNLL